MYVLCLTGPEHSCTSLDTLQGADWNLGIQLTRHWGSLGRRKGDTLQNKALSHDIMAAMVLSLSNPRIESYHHANVFFCLGGKTRLLITSVETCLSVAQKGNSVFCIPEEIKQWCRVDAFYSHRYLTNRMWFHIRHHIAGQNVVDSRGATE